LFNVSYGLTKDPSDGNYMLVIYKMDINLKEYLRQNHNKLTWEKRIKIIDDILYAVSKIHKENAIHRDLHSGNILFNETDICISDLGFCGPADKPLNSIVYGNLPYIAPEVISGKETTFASDIYSIGMLMWEISSGKPPFSNFENDYDLALKIINGMRPKIVPGTPLEYKILMELCWDADPTKRPNIDVLFNIISKINRSNHQNIHYKPNYQNTHNNKSSKNKSMIKKLMEKIKLSKSQADIASEVDSLGTKDTSSRLFTSKIYQFKDFPEPRNAIEGSTITFHKYISYIY
jgi:serine/threonine protein kinase